MKRVCGVSLLFVCLLCLFTVGVSAQQADEYVAQQLEYSGASELWSALSPETRELFETLGIETLSDLGEWSLTPQHLSDTLGDMLSNGLRTPLTVTGMLLCAIVLCAYLGGMKDAVGGEDVQTVYQGISVLAICTVTAVPFADSVRAVQEALSGAAVFMGSFTPVYIAVLGAGGRLRTAMSYQSVVLLFAQLLTWLGGGALLPILLVAFAMGLVSSASRMGNLGKLGEMLLKAVTWSTGLVASAFTAMLTVNGMLGTAKDTLGSRMAKLSVASFVPVVGGALGEAFLTVKGCLGVTRTVVGAFGIVAIVCILLPCLLECICWQICLFVCVTAADVFEQTALSNFLKLMQQVVKTLVALLLVCGLFMAVATVIVAKETV